MSAEDKEHYRKLRQGWSACAEYPSQAVLDILGEICETVKTEEQQQVAEQNGIEILNQTQKEKLYMRILAYSFLFQIRPSAGRMEEFIDMVCYAENLDYRAKYFLFYQVEYLVFMNPQLETKEVLWKKWKLLEEIKFEVKKQLQVELTKIPMMERNKNLVIVITEQFLGERHAPTKVTLDRSTFIKQNMGKEVLIFNTAEAFAPSGVVWFLGAKYGIYKEEKSREEYQYWKGEKLPYFQCDNIMPDIDVMTMLLETVKSLKPEMVIHIGGSSLVAGLIDEMIPVLTIGTTQSGIVPTLTHYQTVQGMTDPKWNWVLQKMGKEEGHVIPAKFTFSFEKQQEITTRREQGLPEEMFLLFTVGNRLDEEVTDTFLDMLESVLSEKIGMVFIGPFDKFELRAKEHPAICPYLYSLGWSSDLFSRIELCDLYVNPLRKGGGTSVVMAMCKGKPAISTDYGDVAGFIGKDFWCKNYEEMALEILRYANRPDFYKKKSAQALELSKMYIDTEHEFRRIIGEYQRLQDVDNDRES